MKTFKAKLTALLMAVGCFLACLGVGVAVMNPATPSVTASAATTYPTITGLTPLGTSTTTVINAYPTTEAERPSVNSWDHAFSFVENSGDGFLWNGEAYVGWELKQPGDFYIGLGGKTAAEGDILTIDGTFRNETLNTNIVFDNCKLRYNGSAWEIAPTVHNIGALVLHGNSNVGGASGLNNVLYLARKDEGELPIKNWDITFTYVSGTGFKVNGEQKTPSAIKSTGDGFYWEFDALSAGDVVSIGGTFFCEAENVEYVITESQFQWTGSAWKVYVPPVEHTVYNVGTVLTTGSSTASAVYFYASNEVKFEKTDSSWGEKLTFLAGSGVGITLNGTQIVMDDIKIPGDMYVNLKTTAEKGDILVIGGTFYNDNLKVKYVIEESQFKWNGSGWESYTPPTVYNIGALVLHVNSSVGGASGANNVLYLARKDEGELPIKNWDITFTYVSGTGFKVNGEQKTPSAIKSTGDGFFWEFSALSAGDIVTIGGTFYCQAENVEYVVTDSQFQWTGSAWKVYVPIQHIEYNVGTVLTTGSSTASAVYFYPSAKDVDPTAGFEIVDGSWSEKLTFLADSGVGITLNGTQIVMDDIKIPGDMYVNLKTTAEKGDILVIGGTFYSDNLKVKYTIEESTFVWNGTAWTDYVVYNVDAIKAVESSTAKRVDFLPADGEDSSFLPARDNVKYTFVAGSGDGISLDNPATDLSAKNITIYPTYLRIIFGATAVEGTIFTIDGTIYSETTRKKIVFDNCKLQYNGTSWEVYEDPEDPDESKKSSTVDLGSLTFRAVEHAEKPFYSFDSAIAIAVDKDWNAFTVESGIGVKLNNQDVGAMIQFPGMVFINLEANGMPDEGDVLVIGGTFYNGKLGLRYIVTESRFMFIQGVWCKYDEVSLVDLGLVEPQLINGVAYDNSGLSQAQTTDTGTALRFGYQSTNTSAGEIAIRLRGENWAGYQFRILSGRVEYVDSISTSTSLSSNTYYEIEIGAIDIAKTENVYVYIKVDGVLKASTVIAKNASYNTNSVSIYANESVVSTTLSDVNHVAVTYVTNAGSVTEYASKDSYVLKPAKTYNTCIGWIINGELYQVGDTLTNLTGNITATALEIGFTLEDGAAIRLNDTADESGIRFAAFINQADLNGLVGRYGITAVSYGMLIIPFDYLGAGQAPNLEDFTAGENILKIVSTMNEAAVIGGVTYLEYRGAMQKLFEANYERLFAGRGYMEITLESGEVITVYTPFSISDNVRSVRSVAQAFKADTAEYNSVSTQKQNVANAYAASDSINLMNYEAYKANNVFDVIAWYYPELDESNGYYNDTNIAIAQKLKDTGVTTVYLDGKYHIDLTTQTNIEKTRQIINFFWSQGLKTIAYGSNAASNLHIDYTTKSFPDFSDCEGFVGFLVWDEPSNSSYDTLKGFAQNFEMAYAGTDVTFMTNLLPRYGFSSNSDFTEYLQDYCEKVLSQVQGEKWLSLDTYPIQGDGTLGSTFLYDLAMLKYYAENNGAHAHAALQSRGFDSTHSEMPTEAEMRMQAYAAMAFGIDSISWWSYGDMRNESEYGNPTDSDEYYTRFANVNNELAAISCVYSAFEWKGVILGTGKDNGSKLGSIVLSTDNDYEAYNAVNGQIGDYLLGKASNGTVSTITSKHLASVSTNKTDWNYLMGVMEDMNGNEGYVLCNYNSHGESHEEDRAQTITITFNSNVTEVVIYRGGVAQPPVTVSNKTLTVELATGEGVIILPSMLG